MDELIYQVRQNINEVTTDRFEDHQIQSVIEQYPIPDNDWKYPDEEGWIPTYDLNRATQMLWLRKASLFSEDFDFQADGASYSRHQKYKHALNMASRYGSMALAETIKMRGKNA